MIDDYQERDITDTDAILTFIETLTNQNKELVLSSDGKNIGAILTAEQYAWFLDQIDAQQNITLIGAKAEDRQGSQSLEEFKRTLSDS